MRALITSRKPMFEFMIRRRLAGHDLETVEGRVSALRASAPVVAGIRDRALGVGYIRNLAGWLGMDPGEVKTAVNRAAFEAKAPKPGGRDHARRRSPPSNRRPARWRSPTCRSTPSPAASATR